MFTPLWFVILAGFVIFVILEGRDRDTAQASIVRAKAAQTAARTAALAYYEQAHELPHCSDYEVL